MGHNHHNPASRRRRPRGFVPSLVLTVATVLVSSAQGLADEPYVGAASEAIHYYTRIIRETPDASWAYARRALAWYDRDEVDIAIADCNEAIALDPRNALAYSNRAIARLAKCEVDKAIADFGEAIRLDGADSASYRQRGLALARKHRCEAAAADFGAAIRLDPKDAWAYSGLAWLLSTCPEVSHRDGKAAVRFATRANELTGWRNPYHLGTLAAAKAETGDFAAAVEWQLKALAQFLGDDLAIKDHGARLALYRSKRPYREGSLSP
jgi:tetratricopeptide (TPR) repeat protein